MKKLFAMFVLSVSFNVSADEVSIAFDGGQLTCNWGELTSNNTSELGTHASDPSGDGTGPGDADTPRVGLANVVDKGNLTATCELIRAYLGL